MKPNERENFRKQVEGLHKTGLSQRAIAKKLGATRASIRRALEAEPRTPVLLDPSLLEAQPPMSAVELADLLAGMASQSAASAAALRAAGDHGAAAGQARAAVGLADAHARLTRQVGPVTAQRVRAQQDWRVAMGLFETLGTARGPELRRQAGQVAKLADRYGVSCPELRTMLDAEPAPRPKRARPRLSPSQRRRFEALAAQGAASSNPQARELSAQLGELLARYDLESHVA